MDLVLTTREIGRLFRMSSLDFSHLPASQSDSWMNNYSGAGVIFGATGGVMEASLRTVFELVTGKVLPELILKKSEVMNGVKKADFSRVQVTWLIPLYPPILQIICIQY